MRLHDVLTANLLSRQLFDLSQAALKVGEADDLVQADIDMDDATWDEALSAARGAICAGLSREFDSLRRKLEAMGITDIPGIEDFHKIDKAAET